MKHIACATALLVASFSCAQAQTVTSIPMSASNNAPVSQQPPADPRDTPEEIAKDAARDLKDGSFYNRPGATRADYDADWQTCRLIARGSRTPGGMITYVSPAGMSPLASGIGGGIGAGIAAVIAEGQLRRTNRRACLMYKGWRKIDVPAARAAQVATMTDAQRDAYFDSIVGATSVEGKITELTSFSLAPDPALRLDAPHAGPATLATAKRTDDPRMPIVAAEGEGLLVLAFARPDAASAGRSANIELFRYDPEKQDLSYQPRDWKKLGDKTTYVSRVYSKDRKAPYELHVLKLTAGQYVIGSATPGPAAPMSSNCFGAPLVSVEAGKVAYLGDLLPFMDVTLANGSKLPFAIGWAQNLASARESLATLQPALAERMENATLRNGATYACAATTMTKWELPGVPHVEADASAQASKADAIAG